jgi:glycosyltransferase involved in cell wall biosynthesis
MQVSVVVTVLNEASSLPGLLESLADQTRPPDEVVVCDGGSIDGTLALLEAEARLPLRILQRPGANIAQGRNVAIAAATGNVIAVTDAGVRLCPQWLERLAAPFEDPETHIVAGFFRPAPQSVFEMAMGATVLPEQREVRPDDFLPSSRSVAFRKSAFESVGGYPEWLDYCEDLILDFRLRDKFGPFLFVPGARAYFRPRPNLRAFFLQYYRYARGDGKANLWPRRHAIRYLTYLVAISLIAVGGALLTPWLWLLYLVGGAAMFVTPWRRLARMWRRGEPDPARGIRRSSLRLGQKLQAVLWVPVIRVTGDIAKMIGYPVGVWWRWRHRDQIPRDWAAG